MLVAHLRVLYLPLRENSISSNPNARTRPIRSGSALSSAPPQNITARFTGHQSHPKVLEISDTGVPRPHSFVAHLPARVVISTLAGAIAGSCSVKVLTSQPLSGHLQRRLYHTSLTHLPNDGISTSCTCLVPEPKPHLRSPRTAVWPASYVHAPSTAHPGSLQPGYFHTAQAHQNLIYTCRLTLHRGPS